MFKELLLVFIVLFSSALYAQQDLPIPIQSALNYRNIPDHTLSVYVESLDTGEVVLSWNEAEPRNPASVEKLLTTLVALDTLGPAYTWRTDVYVLGEVTDGVLDGDLLLKGYGDPYLVTERFWQLLRRIRQSGILAINGDLLIDDSYFDIGNYDPAAFDREPLRAYNVVNRNMEELMVAGKFREDLFYRLSVFSHRGTAAPGKEGGRHTARETISRRHLQRRIGVRSARTPSGSRRHRRHYGQWRQLHIYRGRRQGTGNRRPLCRQRPIDEYLPANCDAGRQARR